MSSKAVKAVKAVKSVRPTRLRASVFLSALEDFSESPGGYSCCAVSIASDSAGRSGARTPEREFYETALSVNARTGIAGIPAAFDRNGSESGQGETLKLNDVQLYTTRIVALQLAALLVEDGFYANAKGELAQRRTRKPAKKGVRK